MAGNLITLVHPNVKGDYDDEVIPLADWVKKFGKKTYLYTHKSCNVRGQYFTKSEVQLMVSEMVSIVNYVRDNLGFMLAKETFQADNVVVDNKHKFMFKEVRLIPIVYDVETLDFTNLFYLIQETIFEGDYSQLPIDMVAFLKMLISSPLANRQLLSCHYALMQDLDRNAFIERCYQIYDDSISQHQIKTTKLFVEVFKKLDKPNKGDWKNLVKFLTSDSKSPVRLAYNYGVDKNFFTRDSDDILRFLHHCMVCMVHLTQKQNQLTHDISKVDVHKIVTLYLPHIVLEMQKKMFNVGLITYEECARFCPRRM